MFPAEFPLACLSSIGVRAVAPGGPARPARPRRRRGWCAIAGLLALLAAQPVAADRVERLIELLRLEEDIEARYDECIGGANQLVEAEIGYEIEERYADIELQPDDLALLIAIYTEFYLSSCEHLAGNEVLNFYRAEFRRRFDADEIEALIAFYRTPVGEKLNAEWLEINRVFGEVLQERQAVDAFEAQRRYEQRMDEFWLRLEQKAGELEPEQGAAAPLPPARRGIDAMTPRDRAFDDD